VPSRPLPPCTRAGSPRPCCGASVAVPLCSPMALRPTSPTLCVPQHRRTPCFLLTDLPCATSRSTSHGACSSSAAVLLCWPTFFPAAELPRVHAQPKSLPPVQLPVVSLAGDGRADRRHLSILPISPSSRRSPLCSLPIATFLICHTNLSRRTRISPIDPAIIVPSGYGRIRNRSRARGFQDGKWIRYSSRLNIIFIRLLESCTVI
jgi:hypothetical protein